MRFRKLYLAGVIYAALHGGGEQPAFTPQQYLFGAGEAGFHGEVYDPNLLLLRMNLLTQTNNLSASSAYTKNNVTCVGGATDPEGGNTAFTIKATGVSGGNIWTGIGGFVEEGSTSSVWARRRTGTAPVKLFGRFAPGANGYIAVPVTGAWTRVEVLYGAATGAYWDFQLTATNDEVDIWLPDFRRPWHAGMAPLNQLVTDWNTEYMAAGGSSVHQWTDTTRSAPLTAIEQTLGAWDDLSGRGNHLTQATANSRPKLSARYNLLVKTEQLTDPAWAKINCAVTADVADPIGGTTAFTLTATASCEMYQGTGANLTPGRMSVWIRRRTGSGPIYFWNNSGNVLQAGITSDWQLRYVDQATNAGGVYWSIRMSTAGDAVDLWHPDWRATADAALDQPAYQRVNAPTDYDAEGFAHFPFYDGNDDYLTAAGGGGASGFLFCAAVCPSAAGTSRVLWSDRGTNTGYRVMINASNQVEISAGNGTAFTAVATAGTLPARETHIVTAWDDGTSLNVQIDNGAIASVARPVVVGGTASFSQCRTNGSSSGYYGGRMTAVTYRQSDCGDAQRAQLKQYHADLARYTLA